VDRLQSSAECLSPEDMATILSGSMSLMNDNNGDDLGDGSVHSHYTASTGVGNTNTSTTGGGHTGGNTSTANNSTKGVSLVGDGRAGIAFEDETAPSTAATTTPSTPVASHNTTTTTNPTTTTDTTSPPRGPTTSTTNTTAVETASTKERNEKIKSLNDAATKKQQDHKKEVRAIDPVVFLTSIGFVRTHYPVYYPMCTILTHCPCLHNT